MKRMASWRCVSMNLNGRKVSVKRPCDAKQGAVTLSFPSCLQPRIGSSKTKTYGTVWQVWSDGQSCSAHISELWLWKLQKIYIYWEENEKWQNEGLKIVVAKHGTIWGKMFQQERICALICMACSVVIFISHSLLLVKGHSWLFFPPCSPCFYVLFSSWISPYLRMDLQCCYFFFYYYYWCLIAPPHPFRKNITFCQGNSILDNGE